jgi:hypothetical protein
MIVQRSHIDPEAWARERGVLHGYEQVDHGKPADAS